MDFKKTKYNRRSHILLQKTFKIEKGNMTRIGTIGYCKLFDRDVNASFYVNLVLLKFKSGYSAEHSRDTAEFINRNN